MKNIYSLLLLSLFLLPVRPLIAQSSFDIVNISINTPSIVGSGNIESEREFLITTNSTTGSVEVVVFYGNEQSLQHVTYSHPISPDQRNFSLTVTNLKPSTEYLYYAYAAPPDGTNTVETGKFLTTNFNLTITDVLIKVPVNAQNHLSPDSRELLVTFSRPAKNVAVDIYWKELLVAYYVHPIDPAPNQVNFSLSVFNLKPSSCLTYVISGRDQATNYLTSYKDVFCTEGFETIEPTQPSPIPGLDFDLLLKGSTPAVYYYADDGKRYVFPNEKTFDSWYKRQISYSILQVNESILAQIPLGGIVTMSPGSLVKIDSDPKTYVVDRGGLLRWIENEELARQAAGDQWASKVTDIPASFFANYRKAGALRSAQQYRDISLHGGLSNISYDKEL